MESYDVIIVGGAAHGASVAYHLAADPAFAGRILLVERDPTVIMQAMMQGRVQIQGDMMKLLAAMQSQTAPTELGEQVAEEIAAITE